ncbi:tRNA (cytosine49-C5)-methyltransferase [Methylomarinovum caldicuralii]|uniref:tRNA (Cytosine49-C5)-methyltransferase n=1 Tax=Methylomarinovum caldicuralii TaxID=438856 RepID=A0AAU9CD44_9GAMM|nr:RsmB/NOP family class I SAM-dependent RNA methyltransferase [Methylomarinovum caldicuralii]BCX80855.1 tRNA (cytosine49-C5)-methyltransferase [Methylomarinovum caldicuralii]
MPLQRYRPLIDDWDAFAAALARPLPRVLWANPLRLDAAALAGLLREEGLAPQPVAWYPGALRLPAGTPVGGRWWYFAGLTHAQEEASLLPVRLLDPLPGERILDLCAAPGGKTAQIAMILHGRGTVVANDVILGRMRPLRANLERLGLLNVSLTLRDGAGYPNAAGAFDRILVDAPCSCEGTLRRHDPLERYGAEVSSRYARLQQALLRRAIALCRPGGRIVYSTCTFAPEENEAVIDAVLRQSDGVVRVVPQAVAGLRTAPGVSRWNGQRFDPQVDHCLRLWPHHNDTGGFFAAVLEKAPDAEAPRAAPAHPPQLAAPELETWLRCHHDLPPDCMEDWLPCRHSSRGIHVVQRDHRPPARPEPEVMGVEVLKTATRPPKVTTAGALLLAPQAQANVVDLETAQLPAYFGRGTFAVAAAQAHRCRRGFVIVRHRGFGLGSGWYDPGAATLQSLFPKRAPGRVVP